MGKTKIECKKLDSLTGTQKCVFCGTSDIDEMKYGPVYMHKNIITHYYCLLLSSNMEQNGRDSDGILGFLPSDIQKEVRRGMRLYCSFCRAGGATLGCAVAKCKVVFHLPCGMKHSTLHQFFGEFKSFCAKHRPVQRINEKILAESSKNAICGICYDKVVPRPIHETLWAPCCQKSAFFHRDCVQKLATSAGYFFKCPLCNNVNTFQQEMKEFGIYIPEQDASWECVPHAYQDLLVRHDTCDSATCSCPSGRKTNIQGTRWELILCKFCGSQGIHIGCGRLKWKCPEFQCDICSNTASESQEGNTRNYNGNRHRLSGAGRTAEIHPSVSADREGEVSDSSNDSESLTISNRRTKVVSPLPQRAHTRQPEKKSNSQSVDKNVIVIEDTGDPVPGTNAIIIEDSDEDIEVVSETKGSGSCLKTNDGSTIPVVQVNSTSRQKRVRVEGDIQVLPEEIVDITAHKQFTPKRTKLLTPPPIKELVYSLPTPQPSTSATFTAPSTSFPTTDISRFVLVDPATLRPEDLPPGTMLYRSVQPVMNVAQTQVQPQIQPQIQLPQPQMPTSLPVQQLGCTSYADAKHPNLSKYWSWSSHNLSSQHFKKHIEKTSRAIKHNCTGRRRGRLPRCDNNRLNPQVILSPIKHRISSDGHFEILLHRRNLGFVCKKRKTTSLLPNSKKKSKIVSRPNDINSIKTSLPGHRKKKTGVILHTDEQKGVKNEKLSYQQQKMKSKKEFKPKHTIKVCSAEKFTSSYSSDISKYFIPLKVNSDSVSLGKVKKNKQYTSVSEKVTLNDAFRKIHITFNQTHKHKITNENNSGVNKSMCKLDMYRFKKIDDYLRKFEEKTTELPEAVNQENCFISFSNEVSESHMSVQALIDSLIDTAIKCAEENDSGESAISESVKDKKVLVEGVKKCDSHLEPIDNLLPLKTAEVSIVGATKTINQDKEWSDNSIITNALLSSVGMPVAANDKEVLSDSAFLTTECMLDKNVESQNMVSQPECKYDIGDESTEDVCLEHNVNVCEIVPEKLCAQQQFNSATVKNRIPDQEIGEHKESKHKSYIDQDANSCTYLPNSEHNRVTNKCGNQIYGIFPKIKIFDRSKFRGKPYDPVMKAREKKKVKEIKFQNVKKYEQKNKKDILAVKKIKSCKPNDMGIINKISGISQYFVPFKKDTCLVIDNDTFSEEEKQKAKLPYDIEKVNSAENTSHSPIKAPLVELQYNVMLT